MIPNAREIAEVVRLVEEVITQLSDLDHDYELECLYQCLEYLTGDKNEDFNLGY